MAGTIIAVLATDLGRVASRPGVISADAAPATYASLATLPGPSLALLAGIAPAAVLLAAGHLLGRVRSHEAELATTGRALALRSAVGRISDAAFAALVACVLLVAVMPGFVELAGGRLLSITSGSMAPAYTSGSMVVVGAADATELRPGDVIVFWREPDVLVTHRIQEMLQTSAGPLLVTRGDAAPAADAEPVPVANVVGRVVLGVPLVGALRAWLFAPLGVLSALLAGIVLARGTAARRS